MTTPFVDNSSSAKTERAGGKAPTTTRRASDSGAMWLMLLIFTSDTPESKTVLAPVAQRPREPSLAAPCRRFRDRRYLLSHRASRRSRPTVPPETVAERHRGRTWSAKKFSEIKRARKARPSELRHTRPIRCTLKPGRHTSTNHGPRTTTLIGGGTAFRKYLSRPCSRSVISRPTFPNLSLT